MENKTAQFWPHRKQENWQWSDFASHHPSDDAITSTLPSHQAAGGITSQVEDGQLSHEAIGVQHGLIDINRAHSNQWLALHVPPHQKLAAPLHLHHQTGCAQFSLTLAPHAEATFYEYMRQDGFSNVLAHIDLGEGAKLTHIRLFDQPADAISFTHHHIDLAASALWDLALITNGARQQRVDHLVHLNGAQAVVHHHGALLANESRHSDIGVAIHHRVAECLSTNQLHAVLGDQAQGGFRATGVVAAGASQSDLSQLSKAIMLHADARMNTKPELAIYHDNVQCAHGVAIGALDPDALFYLYSRGIAVNLAKRILLEAFMVDLFGDFQPAIDLVLPQLERLL